MYMGRFIHQQDLAKMPSWAKDTPELVNGMCAPTSLLNHANINSARIDPQDFIEELPLNDEQLRYVVDQGWSRPFLSAYLRSLLPNDSVISWRLSGLQKFSVTAADNMEKAGYIGIGEPNRAILAKIAATNIVDLSALTPVTATVLPGFGTNVCSHAIILRDPDDTSLEVIDPDKRYDGPMVRRVPIDYILKYLAPNGAGTIIASHDHAQRIIGA